MLKFLNKALIFGPGTYLIVEARSRVIDAKIRSKYDIHVESFRDRRESTFEAHG